MPAFVIKTDNVSGFLNNLRDELCLFHSELGEGERLDVYAISSNGAEHEVKRIIPIPPNMIVCECKNGDRIIQHINAIQLRFSKSKAEEGDDEEAASRIPIGFRVACETTP